MVLLFTHVKQNFSATQNKKTPKNYKSFMATSTTHFSKIKSNHFHIHHFCSFEAENVPAVTPVASRQSHSAVDRLKVSIVFCVVVFPERERVRGRDTERERVRVRDRKHFGLDSCTMDVRCQISGCFVRLLEDKMDFNESNTWLKLVSDTPLPPNPPWELLDN